MTTAKGDSLQCGTCRMPVHVEGVREPHYVHDHGSIFCKFEVANVDGSAIPATPNRS